MSFVGGSTVYHYANANPQSVKRLIPLSSTAVPHVEDDSYVEDDADRQNYLLSDVGCIWRGTSRRKVPVKWEFGQVNK